MHYYLSQHPEVFMPPQKEIHFFGSDLDPAFAGRQAFSREEYLAHFAAAGGSARRIGEASPLYLYSKTAAAEIRSFCPEARILILLRDPVDLAYSLFCGRQFSSVLSPLSDQAPSFEAALQADHGMSLSYRALACYAANVARYLETFGREAVQVVWFEELSRDPATAFAGVCRHIGVDPSFRPDVTAQNSGRHTRHPALLRLLVHRPPLVRRLGRALVPRWVRARAERALWSAAVGGPPPLDPRVREMWQHALADDVRELETLLGVDLAHWQRLHPAAAGGTPVSAGLRMA
jgi:hypothetical protein